MTPQDTVQQLRDARALVKAGWIKGQMRARSRVGNRLMVCTLGALDEAHAATAAQRLVDKHLTRVLDAPRGCGIISMNDSFLTRKRHVLKAFDLAIAEAEGIAAGYHKHETEVREAHEAAARRARAQAHSKAQPIVQISRSIKHLDLIKL